MSRLPSASVRRTGARPHPSAARGARRRRLSGHGPAAVLVLLLGAALTACGTTVPGQVTAGGAAAVGGGELGGGVASAEDAAPGVADALSAPGTSFGTGGPQGVADDPASGSAVRPGVPSGSRQSGVAVEEGSRPLAGPLRGRGFTEQEVLIGVGIVRDDSGAAFGALNIQGLGDPGDPEEQFTAVVDEANRRGGLGGRKIVLVPYYYDINEVLFDPNSAAQKSCTYWTQDKKVFAVVSAAVTTDTFLQCLKGHSTPYVHTTGVDYPRSYRYRYEQFPLYFSIGGMLAERFDDLSVERLVARKYFSGWDTTTGAPGSAPMKLGVIVFDTPEGTAHVKSLTRALARFGLAPPIVFRTSDGIADRTSEQQAAVLRFRSEGVTHVMWAGLTFIRTAEGQNYRPRYFVPVVPSVIAASAPPEQMNGAMGEGWIPAQDVGAADYPGDPSVASTYCLKVLRQAGQSPTNQTMLWTMQAACDAIFPLQAALGASNVMTAAGVRTGFEALGDRVASAVTWTSVFGPGEHASARALRDLTYHRDCTCFRYASRQNHLG